MTKLKDMKPRPPKILIYGEPGTGKTAFVMTIGEPLLLIDTDDGSTTGISLSDPFLKARNEVEILSLHDTNPDHPTAFDRVEAKLVREIMPQCAKKTFPYRAICIDSLTSLANSAIKTVMYNSGNRSKKPTMPEWGLAISRVADLMTVFRSLPVCSILLAHTALVEINDVNHIKLGVYGKNLPSTIIGAFDEVWFARVKNLPQGKRDFVIQTQPEAHLLVRSRYQVPNETSMIKGLPALLSQYFHYSLESR